jgi:hypothetical protein
MAGFAFAWRRNVAAPLGVLGGGALIALSFWAIAGTVNALVARTSSGESWQKSTGLQLVKFFTRHGMLALAAYVMMVRLHLDPVGLLAGVSSLAVAVAVEVLRDLRWRRSP